MIEDFTLLCRAYNALRTARLRTMVETLTKRYKLLLQAHSADLEEFKGTVAWDIVGIEVGD